MFDHGFRPKDPLPDCIGSLELIFTSKLRMTTKTFGVTQTSCCADTIIRIDTGGDAVVRLWAFPVGYTFLTGVSLPSSFADAKIVESIIRMFEAGSMVSTS